MGENFGSLPPIKKYEFHIGRVNTGGRKLKVNLFQIQRGLAYLFIFMAVLTLILSLGFITNFYELFYNGTNEMFNFYKDLQVLNKAMFNASIVFILLAFMLLAFDITKKSVGLFGSLYIIGSSFYITLTSRMILSAIPYYKNIYLSFDYSMMDTYKVSTLAFTFGNIIFQIWIIISMVFLLTIIINFIKGFRKKPILGGSHE